MDGLRQLEPAAAPTLPRRLRVSDVLAFPALEGATVYAGANGLERPLVRLNVMQVPTARFARRNELILIATSAFDEPQLDLAALVAELAGHGVAALAAHTSTLERLGEAGRAAAEEHALPLIALPAGARLSTLLTAVLETLVASQAAHLRMVAAARDRLVDVLLSGGDLQRLAAALGDIVGDCVAILDEGGAVLAISAEEDQAEAAEAARAWLEGDTIAPAETGSGWLLWPIVAGGARLGCVAARPSGAGEGVALAAVQNGARTAAFAIMHELEEAAAVSRLNERFVRDLLVGHLSAEVAHERARALGWDPATPYRLLLLRDGGVEDGADVGEAVRGRAPDALVVRHDDDRWVALLPTAGGEEAEEALVADLVDSLDGVRAGVSAQCEEIAAAPFAYGQAREALRSCETFGFRTAWRAFAPQSPLRMLAHVPPAELAAFADDTLAPLDAVEPEQRQILTETLALLVDTGLNVADTARRGGWHYNTVRYRVGRLTDLLGPFMEDGERLDALMLALLLRRELSAAG
ncbi:MAG: PucR family transcriptional regulator ligand-binding domain-containing protein [Actinobacteria bacterium]|nr:PucR family transcriptional regulator ligand-binding domain-containing protein [Actinomycetota bacterium]